MAFFDCFLLSFHFISLHLILVFFLLSNSNSFCFCAGVESLGRSVWLPFLFPYRTHILCCVFSWCSSTLGNTTTRTWSFYPSSVFLLQKFSEREREREREREFGNFLFAKICIVFSTFGVVVADLVFRSFLVFSEEDCCIVFLAVLFGFQQQPPASTTSSRRSR